VAEGVRVKICGLVCREDALVAEEVGADYLGVIVSAGFRRSVPLSSARAVVEGTRARKVAVMVDESADAARAAARALGAEVIQLHGEEDPTLLEALRADGVWTLWKAVRARSLADVERAVELYGGVADALLVEGWMDGVLGGGGARLALDPGRVRDSIPTGLDFVLAGGLDPETVGSAVRSFRPDVVDVSSGVERAIGAKDPGRVRAFVHEARAAAGDRASAEAPAPRGVVRSTRRGAP
jgi:phosphoribosylanthranilate isomerase